MTGILNNRIIIFLFFIIISCGGKSENGKEKNLSLFGKVGKEEQQLDSIRIDSFLIANPEFKPYRKKMIKFYQRRDFSLAWSKNGDFLPQADMFINMVDNLDKEGIEASEQTKQNLRMLYKEASESSWLKKKAMEEKRESLDLLLSASYFKYAGLLWRGRVDPEEENLEWYVQRKKIKYGKTLDSILDGGSKNLFAVYQDPEYIKLKKALIFYKGIQQNGGWPMVILDKKSLKKGDKSASVIKLRQRLLAGGDLKSASKDSTFDASVESALKNFQIRHGLKDDGVLAGNTLNELNIPVSDRIEQILVNMERWRWVPQKTNPDYFWINIPEYKLHVFENGKEVSDMNVIVGKAATSTPIFNDVMEYIVFSPYWSLPKSIVVNELFPLLQKNPIVLEKENMEVIKGNDVEHPVDPYQVDWTAVDPERMPYTFRQRPGAANALGYVKFLFPNDFDVYLHDTPTGYLFNQSDRGFSHGCIRLEEPEKLANYILRDDPAWNSEKIHKTMYSGEESYVKLKKKIPVYIVYFTSWVDGNGNVHFRDDIYKHDEKLARVYFEK